MKDAKPPGSSLWQLYKMGGLPPAIASMFNPQNAQQMAFIRSIMKEQRRNALYDVSLSSVEAVVFDLETTGFSPYNGDEILSVGGVAVVGETVLEHDTFYREVNPRRGIPAHIAELTGLTNESAARAPELIDVLRDFLAFVHRRVLIAHGSGHDKSFLNAALWRTSKAALTHRMLDTMMIAKWLFPGRQHYGLDQLLAHYGILDTGRHNALEDSRMTARLWVKLVGEAAERGVRSLGELYSQLSIRC